MSWTSHFEAHFKGATARDFILIHVRFILFDDRLALRVELFLCFSRIIRVFWLDDSLLGSGSLCFLEVNENGLVCLDLNHHDAFSIDSFGAK